MSIHPSAIGFDLDCVVVDTMEAFIRLAREDYQLEVLPEEITEFQVEECLTIDQGIIDAIFKRLLDDPLASKMQPMPGAVSVLREMATIAPLTFVTARPDSAAISAWLNRTLGADACAASTLVAMGDHDGKGKHIKELGLSHFVDDRFETCERLHCDGIHALVFEQPWNKGRHNLPSVASWQEIAELLTTVDGCQLSVTS